MNKRWLRASVILAVLAIAGVAATAPKKGTKIKVRVPSAKVMKDPDFVGDVVGSVSRGAEVTFLGSQGDFYQISTPAGDGWVARNQLTDKEVKASTEAGSSSGAASDEDVELAARGFSKQVEEQYRASHTNLDFTHIDAIAQIAVDPVQEKAFIAAGKLAGGGK